MHIAGTFLYDAIFGLEKMKHFCYEEECFSFLYNTSVGIERLEKVVIILLEHNNQKYQEEFEKSLITHNHLDLIKRIENILGDYALHDFFLYYMLRFGFSPAK